MKDPNNAHSLVPRLNLTQHVSQDTKNRCGIINVTLLENVQIIGVCVVEVEVVVYAWQTNKAFSQDM